jgi:predicted DNA-binding transcriptional regulator AlpA
MYEVESDDRLLTDEEAAPLLGLKPMTLATLRSQGRGPKYYKDGRLVRYTPRLIREYLETRLRTPESADTRRRRKALAAEVAQSP